jgi:uncharacterized repeat protein (TIGR03803 family)
MTTRVLAFFVAVASAALVGCSSVSQSAFAPFSVVAHSSLSEDVAKERVLHSFVGGANDGAAPISGLVRAGKLYYGTSGGGGTYGKGTVFSIAPDGTGFALLYSFQGKQDGRGSVAGLTALDGTLYGTTENGGKKGHGTVFSITPGGTFTTLYSFQGGASDGAKPMAALTNVRGTLYGTTANGGSAGGGTCFDCGTLFSISTSGTEKVRYFFGSAKDDGIGPRSPLVLAGGKLYGTTTNGGNGGAFGNGAIFSATPGGSETVLYRFKNDADGSCSFNCYLTAVSGTLYGTAAVGGKGHIGSVFSVTPGGSFKTLYSVPRGGGDAGYPFAPLTNVGGTLYGTMSQGPLDKKGTVFSITTSGALTTVHTFTGGSDGAAPSSILRAFDGKLFGTTGSGGSKDAGTIFSISEIKS